MYRNIDFKLTNLSYKTARHVLLGRKRFSKFETNGTFRSTLSCAYGNGVLYCLKIMSSKTVDTKRNFAQHKENFKICLKSKIASWLPQLFSFDKDRTNITRNTADQWFSDIVDFLHLPIEEGDDEEDKEPDNQNYDELGLNNNHTWVS
ncbi:hypothetical protein METBIDRAFT_12400 [Metschnikowia bicuspidata var. bicuspidata NRRL YB-4993]|uniref:Uncharacterized protein n=1 Tax=Metschnikowia bicuspidata var. bicuspidata NRRL YB-4993 TaxID=869754 RepID=A0A1A0H925_9ASCO|nr:hypothetical protein METBIDRAFT_12400 [Metschnikowia bicuspidata var. bicuspidata NRRL YB-4993]OBA20382.1 hypothetical protein METBIDRAFT_12400 [Metschnikowia bicuspidata var. bicuspidata NRRL YB-4993]